MSVNSHLSRVVTSTTESSCVLVKDNLATVVYETRSRGYKTFFMLNLVKQELSIKFKLLINDEIAQIN